MTGSFLAFLSLQIAQDILSNQIVIHTKKNKLLASISILRYPIIFY